MKKVIGALKNKEYGLDKSEVALLAQMAPHYLKPDLLARHSFQDEAVGAIEDVFVLVQKRMDKLVEEAGEKAAAVDDVRTAAASKLSEHEQAFEAAKEAVKVAETDVNEASGRHDAAEAQRTELHKKAEAAAKTMDETHQLAKTFRTAVEGGPWDVGGVEKLVQDLESWPEMPDSLISAAPTALNRTPDLRDAFDQTVLQTMETAVEKALVRADLESQQAKEAAELEETRVCELYKLFNVGCAALGEANSSRNAAEEALQLARAEHAEAIKNVDAFQNRVHKERLAFREAEAKVSSFYTELSAFRFLQSRSEDFTPPRCWSPSRPSRRPTFLDEEDQLEDAFQPKKKAAKK